MQIDLETRFRLITPFESVPSQSREAQEMG